MKTISSGRLPEIILCAGICIFAGPSLAGNVENISCRAIPKNNSLVITRKNGRVFMNKWNASIRSINKEYLYFRLDRYPRYGDNAFHIRVSTSYLKNNPDTQVDLLRNDVKTRCENGVKAFTHSQRLIDRNAYYHFINPAFSHQGDGRNRTRSGYLKAWHFRYTHSRGRCLYTANSVERGKIVFYRGRQRLPDKIQRNMRKQYIASTGFNYQKDTGLFPAYAAPTNHVYPVRRSNGYASLLVQLDPGHTNKVRYCFKVPLKKVVQYRTGFFGLGKRTPIKSSIQIKRLPAGRYKAVNLRWK